METNHEIDWDSAKLIKNIRNASHLNTWGWESMFIRIAQKPLMNEDEPPIVSSLYDMIDSNHLQ